MPIHRSTVTRLAFLAASSVAALPSPEASATVIVSRSGGVNQYRVTFMPDYDQRRDAASGISGLASGGANFCATTSGTDLLSYIRRHGYVLPGIPEFAWSENFTAAQYESVTTTIASVGTQMGTVRSGASAGTSTGQWLTGMSAILPADCFTINQFVFNATWAPTAEWLATRLSDGTWGLPVVNICCGWYQSNPDGSGALIRAGGHCMALNRIADAAGSASDELCFRDPWTDGADSRTSQSLFGSACFPFATSAWTVGGAGSSSVRSMSLIAGYSGGNGLLDKAYIVEPVYGLTRDVTGAFIDVVRPVRFSFEPSSAARARITVNPGGFIVDAVRDMYSPAILALVQRTGSTIGTLKRVDGQTGAALTINTGGQDVVGIASGRFGEVYAVNKVSATVHDLVAVQLDPNGNAATQPPLVRRMPFTFDAVEYDDFTDRVIGINAASKAVVAVSRGANGAILTATLPTTFALSGKVSVATDPRSGRVYLTSAGSSAIYGVTVSASGALSETEVITGSAIVSPQALQVDGLGQLVFVSAGKTWVMRKTGQAWALNTASPLGGLAASGFLRVGRSRINVPAGATALLTTDEVPPQSLPQAAAECEADLNLDGVVDGADLGTLLSQWGTNSIADLDQNDTTDGGDLGILLASWGPCP